MLPYSSSHKNINIESKLYSYSLLFMAGLKLLYN